MRLPNRCLFVAFNHPNFLFRQPVQLVNQPVNLSIRRVNLTLVQLAVGLRSGGEVLVQLQHLLNERHHAVVAGNVGRVGEVDGADGKLLDELTIQCKVAATEWRADCFEVIVQSVYASAHCSTFRAVRYSWNREGNAGAG